MLANCQKEQIMIKVREYLMRENVSATKSAVVTSHIEQWYNKSLFGQWPNLLIDRNVNSSENRSPQNVVCCPDNKQKLTG